MQGGREKVPDLHWVPGGPRCVFPRFLAPLCRVSGWGKEMGAAEHGASLLCTGWASKCQPPSAPQALVQPAEASLQSPGKISPNLAFVVYVGEGRCPDNGLPREISKGKCPEIHPGEGWGCERAGETPVRDFWLSSAPVARHEVRFIPFLL